MKKSIFIKMIFVAVFGLWYSVANAQQPIAKVYVYRLCNYEGSATKIKLYHNDDIVIKQPSCSKVILNLYSTSKHLITFKSFGLKPRDFDIKVDEKNTEFYIKVWFTMFTFECELVPVEQGRKEFAEISNSLNPIDIK